jgi:hypothetical protein
MRSRRLVPLALISVALLFLAGCGSGGASAPKFSPPPTGSYTNASFSGQYAFSLSGVNQNGFFALAGSVQADGNGSITSGIMDLDSAAGIATSIPVTGTYSVSADGRAIATLSAPSITSTFTLDFVVVSSTRALVARFDTNSSASGTFEKQDSSAFSAPAINGQYAFTLSGIGASGNTYQTAGLFVADGAGNLTGGTQDFNSNGTVVTSQAITGSYSVSSPNGRGTFSLTSSLGTMNFAFYVVDATHLKVVETDGVPLLSGDVYKQTGSFANSTISGPYAFTVGGGLSAPLVAGGVFTADGNGAIASGIEDLNEGGSILANQATTGTYAMSSNGRGTLTLTNSAGTFNFAIYPSSGGLLMMGLDSNVPESGAAFLQTGLVSATPAASINGNYGYNLTGVSFNTGGEVDAIAHLSANGSSQFTGTLDFNLTGSVSRSLAYSGPYTLASNGRGTATLTSSLGAQDLTIYLVSPSRILFIETDSGLTAIGEFDAQQ